VRILGFDLRLNKKYNNTQYHVPRPKFVAFPAPLLFHQPGTLSARDIFISIFKKIKSKSVAAYVKKR
jgi:hypothetical protein